MKVPVPLEEENTIMPVGEYPPMTEATQDVEAPTATEVGTQATPALVEARATTKVKFPELT